MASEKPRPTVDELFELLKRSGLPTILVEGKDDIIFYRNVEQGLSKLGLDVLPAGNKDAVLKLLYKLHEQHVKNPIIFIVDNDLWVHSGKDVNDARLITTEGYSVENDIFSDGDLCALLNERELVTFQAELQRFIRWYALAVSRQLRGIPCEFRTHPKKVLESPEFCEQQLKLFDGETYPADLYNEITSNYQRLLRGKSLFGLLLRQLSGAHRKTKFGVHQLMEFGASRKGEKYDRICTLVREAFSKSKVNPISSGAAVTESDFSKNHIAC
ncbi:DUF4435 domain-containing protein [Castellaniella sp. UC4442_H9]